MVTATSLEKSSPGLLTSRGIANAFHYAPLHYLLFIARTGALYSKASLRRQGYDITHFRRTSRDHDDARGFPNYVHLSLKQLPPILEAKLKAGFPHFEIRIPAGQIEQQEFHLCRFNIAKCRYLRRVTTAGPVESATNGRYYGNMQLPIAITDEERALMIDANYPRNMVEILIPNELPLPSTASFIFFSRAEYDLALTCLKSTECRWEVAFVPIEGYVANSKYLADVHRFLDRSATDPKWRGDGLEFDLV